MDTIIWIWGNWYSIWDISPFRAGASCISTISSQGAAKKPVGKKAAVKNPAKEGESVIATDKVVAIIQKTKEGVDVSTLISSSGLEDKQIRNILNRALNLGKIKRASRGVYIVA